MVDRLDETIGRRDLMLRGTIGAPLAILPIGGAAAAQTVRRSGMGDAADRWTTEIKAADTQILFAHSQEALVGSSKTNPPATIRRASRVLADLARVYAMPITFALVPEGIGEPAPIAELRPFVSAANRFVRLAATPFLEDAFTAHLARNGRKILILAGHATEVVIRRTAHDAIEAGYTVYVPVDAVGGISERTEEVVFRQIERAGGNLTSTWSIVAAIAPDFANGLGAAAFKAAQPLQP